MTQSNEKGNVVFLSLLTVCLLFCSRECDYLCLDYSSVPEWKKEKPNNRKKAQQESPKARAIEVGEIG